VELVRILDSSGLGRIEGVATVGKLSFHSNMLNYNLVRGSILAEDFCPTSLLRGASSSEPTASISVVSCHWVLKGEARSMHRTLLVALLRAFVLGLALLLLDHDIVEVGPELVLLGFLQPLLKRFH